MQQKDPGQPLKDFASLQNEPSVTSLSKRRSFIHAAVARFGTTLVQRSPIGVSTASDATPGHPKGNPPGSDKKIGFALVGLGKLTLDELLPAFAHCRYCLPVALVSGDAAKAAKVAQQYGIASSHIYNYQNFDDIRNNLDVDVAYIVLPNNMHEAFTTRAAQASKHVLCEKPMSTSAASAQRMIDACKEANKKLMIAYRIQYEPKNSLLQQWVREEKQGKVRLIEMVNVLKLTDPNVWRLKKDMGGGPLFDIGIYCLNTARFLLGTEPEWVNASMYSTPNDPRFKEVEEAVLFQMGFPNGVLVNGVSSFALQQERRYRCLAEDGWVGLENAFAYEGLQLQSSQPDVPQLEDENHFALEMDHFAQCILQDKPPYTPGEEGLQDHRIMEAIFQSAQEQKRVMLQKVEGMDVYRNTK